jgi:hypothetical protein
VAGHAELAHHHDVQGEAEAAGHLRGHRHATAGQPEDDRVPAPQVLEPGGQVPAGVGAVAEEHGAPPVPRDVSIVLRADRAVSPDGMPLVFMATVRQPGPCTCPLRRGPK